MGTTCTYNSSNNNDETASLSVPLHHVPQISSTNLHSLMKPSYLYSQHHQLPHHYHHQQQQPAHQMTRFNPASSGSMNSAIQRIGLEGLATRPGSAGVASGLIDLSCSGPRLQHRYQVQPSASDVSDKVYQTSERDVRCQNVVESRVRLQRETANDLRSMVASSLADSAQQVLCCIVHITLLLHL